MKMNSFLTGVAAGVVLGSAVSMTGAGMMKSRGRRCAVKKGAGRVLHTMGDIMDGIASTISD